MALSPAALAMGGHFANFLAQHGFPVAPYQTDVKPYPSPDVKAMGWANPGEVNWTPQYAAALESLAARLGKRGRLNERQLKAAQVGLHEGLHHMRYGRTPAAASGNRAKPGEPAYWEEAATEAVTHDLLPIFTAKMFGHKLRDIDSADQSYPDQVTNLRQLSVFGSGAKNYKAYKARVWRRQFSHADPETRQRMADQAMQKRIAWGKTRRSPMPGPDRPPR